ncbi:hypothetical protein [Glaciecola sp. 33A]|uniref:hypothetical protein n=1 Tax=Glaciecola sp. 33A TaxID=2057807 RepID=UPI000C31C640|nr:hypothetical protein [Glaciecola sp. 33A]PKI02508.1 hypothetical protein CXF81_06105 [Glaciecola sp. 33A]
MRLNRDVLITSILKHQNRFFKLLDEIDENDGSYEIQEISYLLLYNNEICPHEDDLNVHEHLTLDSLLENGIFIHYDPNTGKITLEKVIVDLLRFLDIKRSRELSNSDFEALRASVVDLTEKLSRLPLLSDEFNQASRTFHTLLSEIHSKIKENVSRLTSQVEDLSVDYSDYNSGDGGISVHELYDRVIHLNNNYVKPCYEFINPDLQMLETRSFSDTIKFLVTYFEDQPGYQQQALNLRYRVTAITAYYKDIDALVQKLSLFSRSLEQDRKEFIAIDSAFTQLQSSLTQFRHGMQRNKYITPDLGVFEDITCFDGVVTRRTVNAQKFDLRDAFRVSLRFKEYMTVLNETDLPDKTPVSIQSVVTNVDENELRNIAISKLMMATSIPNNINNVHQWVSDLLANSLSDYWLGDLLVGLQEVESALAQHRINRHRKRHRIVYGPYYLDYLLTSATMEISNV